MQQECEAISKVSQIAPLATLTKITKITDPFFRITRCVAQTTDLEVSRKTGHEAYRARKEAAAERARNEATPAAESVAA